MYELIIVGGGPAGSSAAVYAARKQLKTLLITDKWGGQSIVSPNIQNWIGTPSISGNDLANNLRTHVETYANNGLEIINATKVINTNISEKSVVVETASGDTYETKALFVATGSGRRKLNVPGAEEFDQKGLTYCATCDGPLFSGKDVAVIGGGNAGFETASQLLAYTKNVTLLHRSDQFKADQITVKKVLGHENMHAITNAETLEVFGDKMVAGLKYKDIKTGEEHTLDVEGIFVEIGLVPNTDWISETVDLDDYKKIKVNPKTQQTSNERIWAAGDVTDALYHQNNIAVGDAIKAIENIYSHLKAK